MFKIVWPWLLLLLPLPLIIRKLLPMAKQGVTTALKFPFFDAMRSIIQSHSNTGKASSINLSLAFIAWCLLVFAAAGPQWLGDPITLARDGRNIMLAIDLSGSMQTQDMTLNGNPANRLQIIKSVAGRFITQRVGDRIGLILFGTRAYVQTPLTFDRKTALAMLNDASIALPGPQTAIGDAIGLAIKRLQKYPKQSRVLILLTDGQNNAGVASPLDAAKVAAKEDIRIYTIGLGAERMAVQSFFGIQLVNPSSDLDEHVLQQIAKITGGLYFRAENADALKNIYSNLNKLEPVETNSAIFRLTTPLYPWPLGLALVICLYLLIQGRKFK